MAGTAGVRTVTAVKRGVTPRAPTLAALLRKRADDRGSHTAYRYLEDGENETRSLTFAELDLAARAIAGRLQRDAEAGDRALILTADSIDFILAFMACQYAGVIAVPAYPPFPMQSERRVATLVAIARNSGASVVLTSPMALRDPVASVAPELAALPWIAVDAVPPEQADEFRSVPIRPDDISFLQYTSGSTSLPKGVVVTHDALMHNEELIFQSFGDPTGEERGLGWLPLYHDMGLLGLVVQTVYVGAQTVLMPPLAFVQRPVRWLRALSRYGAGYTGGPNFAYELCVRRIRPEERADLDLSCWRIAFNGAEPIRPATLDAFAEAFEPYGFDRRAWFPCYGLAETTLIATGPEPRRGATRLTVDLAALQEGRLVPGGDHELVGAGRPKLHRRLAIVDPETCRRVEPGVVGEIWLAGPDVAREYWNRPEETERSFDAWIAGSDEGPFLRTGDLGALHDGELFVTGRLKDLIIVAGRNHYPQDIEATAESAHDALRRGCAVAFTVESDGGERLVVVVEVKDSRAGDVDVGDVKRAVRAAISSQHGIQPDDVVVAPANSVPKTSSGKLQRSACRQALEDGELPEVGAPEAQHVG